MTAGAPVMRERATDTSAAILLVDDRADSLMALRAVLEPLGQPILTARSGDAALRHLLRNEVAVILLDVNMPGLDGFSTAALIKRRERTRDIPIIFLTADRDASDRGQVHLGYSSGAVDFLVKPFDPWALTSKVSVFVALHRAAAQLRGQVAELTASRAALDTAQRIARLTHFSVDVCTGTVEWAAGAAGVLGVNTELLRSGELTLPFWSDLMTPGDGEISSYRHVSLERPDGFVSSYVARTENERDRTGQLVTVRGTLQNVTEQELTKQRLADTTDALRREHAAVTMLQAAMLPTVLPHPPALDIAARYLPAEVGVGGDWYDASLRSDGKMLLAIGDVAGHGLTAATTMNEIRIAARAFSLIESSPARILQRLNDFSQATGSGDLVTALIVLLDPVTGNASVASAGHLPPLISDDAGTRYIELRVSPPIGTASGCPHETTFTLRPGGRLLLFTDGLVELRRHDLDERMALLAEMVGSSAAKTEALVEEVLQRMLPSIPPSDDVAVLAVERALDPVLRIRLPAVSTNLAPIRAMVRRWLGAQGASQQVTDDVVLAVGELISNVISHAHSVTEGIIAVEAEVEDGRAIVTVRDTGRWRRPTDRGGGRGLGIVRALVDDVRIERGDDGSSVRIMRSLTDESVEP